MGTDKRNAERELLVTRASNRCLELLEEVLRESRLLSLQHRHHGVEARVTGLPVRPLSVFIGVIRGQIAFDGGAR